MLLTAANQISILRILLILPFVICMLSTNDPDSGLWMRRAALTIFIIMSVSDALDGYIARIKKQTTQLGRFLDPLADKLLITCACILLAVPETSVEGYRLPGAVVVLIIGKDVLLSLGFTVAYFVTGRIRIHPVWAGKLSTFLQLVMVMSILLGPDLESVASFWPGWVRGLWTATAGSAILATGIYIWDGFRYIEDFEKQLENKEMQAEK